MGNVVGTACVVGAALVIAIKPACDYTIRAVVDRASAAFDNKLAAVEGDIISKIKDIQESRLAAVEESLINNTQAKNELQTDLLKKAIDEVLTSSVNDIQAGNVMALDVFRQAVDEIKEAGNYSKMLQEIERTVLQTAIGVAEANSAIEKLPNAIEATSNKYSTYLHEEHEAIFKLLSAT